MKYDDASWHYGSDSFPKSQPDEHGGTHIGLFLKWCFTKGWASELHLSEEPDDTARVSNGSLTGTAFLFKYCDGKLTNEDFNAEGNAFAERYYGEQGLYLDDYARHFGQHEYISPESAHDFAAFSSMLEQRWRTGVLTKLDIKPWWKFW
ncbi:MAG TPA: hypothetical protein VFS47_06980 [Steroidobacteraceae bacterium]|nr:hypothetical protein [Steroidobacteraceae bacterium]